ncbi:TetR family transcriptional regulator [Scopulibacillus darangshiensis]|uniref:TetR family transcriptional regulator n=1 Tax=Scopulibacillus darangshiensis TaxID=442528 RepID=A0A4R2PAM7_9BACL|nr:TetR/AcrR family transcriptional regulator [Scopulibacillus darangshiensis]TCP32130.1 TetR family transcriptional regulator [Scopulibacillus darangshiensis]
MSTRNRPKFKLIVDAAVDVIAENGFHKARISKIAKRAGVADGTIYIYFKNKEDLLITLFQEKMGQFIEKIEQEIAGKQEVKEKFLTMVQMHFKQLAADHHLAIVTQLELRQSDTEIRLKINDILRDYLKLIDGILEEGKEKGVFRAGIDSRLARQMIFGTIDETVTNWVMNEHKYDLVALSEPVADLLINGLT